VSNDEEGRGAREKTGKKRKAGVYFIRLCRRGGRRVDRGHAIERSVVYVGSRSRGGKGIRQPQFFIRRGGKGGGGRASVIPFCFCRGEGGGGMKAVGSDGA